MVVTRVRGVGNGKIRDTGQTVQVGSYGGTITKGSKLRSKTIVKIVHHILEMFQQS